MKKKAVDVAPFSAIFFIIIHCFAPFDSRDFKFSTASDGKGLVCVAEFRAMIIINFTWDVVIVRVRVVLKRTVAGD